MVDLTTGKTATVLIAVQVPLEVIERAGPDLAVEYGAIPVTVKKGGLVIFHGALTAGVPEPSHLAHVMTQMVAAGVVGFTSRAASELARRAKLSLMEGGPDGPA